MSDNIANYFHQNFTVVDMDKMVEFYTKGFGYKVYLDTVFDTPEFKRRLVLLTTDSESFKIEFLQHIKPTPTKKSEGEPDPVIVGPNHLGIPVKDIDKKYEELKALGMKWESEPFDVKDAKIRIVFGRDIEGNRIELLQPIE